MRNLENYKNNRFKLFIFSLILFVTITTGLVTVAEAETTAQFDFSDIYNADTVYGNDKSGAFDSWGALITSTVAENNENPRDDGLPDDGVFPSTSTHPRIELANFHNDDGYNAWQSTGTGSVTASVTNGQYKTVHLIASAGGAGTENPAKFEVVLHYGDETTDRSQEFTVPDWFGSISDPGYALKDNMDRISIDGTYDNADNPAIWGFAMQADSTKTLESITIDVTANEAGSFNFFGGAATTQETDVIEKPRISSFELTNPSDKNLAVNFDSDKQLSAISVSITGAESATFTGTDFTETDNVDGTYTYETTYNSNSDGDYTATLETAEDAEGNDGASGEQYSVNIDTTPPQITGFKVSNPSGQNIFLNFTSNEDLAVISVSISGAESATFTGADFTETDNGDGTYTYETTYNGNSDGDYTATLEKAEDADGNDGASGEKDSVNIDTTPPVINAVEFPVKTNTSDTVEIGFNVTDNIGINHSLTEFNITGNTSAELTKDGTRYNYTLNVPSDSVNDIVFNATFYDDAGNENASDDKRISVSDNIDPVIQDIVYEEDVNASDTVEIVFNVTDNIGVNHSLTEFNITGNSSAELTPNGNWYNYTFDVPVDSVDEIVFNATFYDDAYKFNASVDKKINVSPIADFSANVTRGTTPLSVEFTDNSSGLVEEWDWDFGDGNISNDQNTSHVFGPGNFTVNLTVNNSKGTSSKELNIRAAEEPVYEAAPNETELLSTYGDEKNFSINSTLYSSYEWFIDGTPLNGTGVTLYNNNTDDSAHLSYCKVNTSQYIDQDDFFMDVYNISAHVSNESIGRTDVISWEWTVTNSSAEDADDIDQIINKTPDTYGHESHVRFNTSNETSEKTGIECSINTVSFNTSNETGDIQIKIEVHNVSALNESEIDFAKESVYQYMDISFNNESLVNEGSNNRSIEFKVHNEVNGGTLLINTVYLRHKDTSGWEAYKPELLRNDGIYSYFIVRDIPGFSPFAVTADYEYDSATKSDDGLPAYLKWKMFKEQMEDSTEGDEVVDIENPESEDTVFSQQPDSTDIPEDTNKEDTTTAEGDNNLAVMGIGLLGLIAILLIISKRKEK